MKIKLFAISAVIIFCFNGYVFADPIAPMTAERQSQLSPVESLKLLKEGNERFRTQDTLVTTNDKSTLMNYSSMHGQYPFAAILSCIDSRADPALLFDQNIGDIFVARVAGNIANTDNIASLEYAVLYAGSKLIVVLGHTQCGAVAAACNSVQGKGSLPHLLDQLEPAVDYEKEHTANPDCKKAAFIYKIEKRNVIEQINRIYKESPELAKYAKENKIMIIGGMYNVANGKVTFFDRYGNPI